MRFSEPPKFISHRLLGGGHRQTALPYFLPWWGELAHQPTYSATQHLVDLGDGDKLVMHDDCPVTWRAGQRVVMLVHGLGGSYSSGYMARVAQRFFARGYRVFRMDMRSCGAGLLHARGVFHADRNEDLRLAVEHVAGLCPTSGISICGFSLGANLALKMLGTNADRLPEELDSAFAVAPPANLDYCCRVLSSGLGRAYNAWYAKMLWKDFSSQRETLERAEEVKITRAPSTLYEFDKHVTTKLGGYDSVDEYYEAASSGVDLWRIRVPTAVLLAADDPIVPGDVLKGFETSSAVQVFVAEGGGHVGFYARKSSDPDERWMDWRLIQWAAEADEARDAAKAAARQSQRQSARQAAVSQR